jgi:uncharacterized OsmC-like protein
MSTDFPVAVAAGSLDATVEAVTRLPHAWTPGGVAVQTVFTGAHLLHLAAAACVLNDLYREAELVGVPLEGVRVDAAGGFDTQTWQSLGIRYAVQVDSPAPDEELARLVALVDDVAEVPRALRAGADVRRVEAVGR